ncbi:MAG: SurA N-terminal domain-containing protein, partial [Acidobacteriota bacterium]
MLKAMRKNLKSLSPTLWLVIAAFIIAIFAVWGGAGRLGESRGTNTLVTIGDQKITADTYYQTFRQRIEAIQKEFKSIDASLIQQLNIPQQVLEQLIQQSLLFRKAKSLGIQASPEEIRERIKSYPAFLKDGQFIGFEEYKKILDWNRIPMATFEESIRKEIVLEKTVRWLTAGVTVNPEEVWDYYKKNNESARIEFLVMETDSIEIAEEPSTEELKVHYEQNRENFIMPERREGIYVFLLLDEVR